MSLDVMPASPAFAIGCPNSGLGELGSDDTHGCQSGGDANEIPLDDLSGGGWIAITDNGIKNEGLDGVAIRTLDLNEDFQDPSGIITGWMKKNDASWVILRPDQFVYAVGTGAAEFSAAATEFRRQIGRAAASAA